MVHSMAKMKGNKMFMSIKIDLEKAYDRLNWNYVKNCLKECKFPPNLVNIIQHCITSPSFKILWNDDKTDTFTPTRGIRQGDPLSPYLFFICMDRLSHMIADQVEARYWKPMRACRYGPQISHLLFANDLLLFAEASIEQAHCILNCLDIFCKASGQKINSQKTEIYFSKNVDKQLMEDILKHTGYTQVNNIDRYLGANISPGRTTRGKFNNIIDKIRNRLSGWKH
ncbi:ribonuclease H [Trifolium pratense]|uniref:Ribonuclease H n=1 Tax=Trifolium pratense TaxID=57577 RepID=A0A2K3L3L8_TRIPR|nr:ribonuclease H [Trifolium pratense]